MRSASPRWRSVRPDPRTCRISIAASPTASRGLGGNRTDYSNYLQIESRFMGAADGLHLTERFTRAAPGTIDYEITLDDSATWTRPWTAVIHLRRADERIYEFACHEGSFEIIRGVPGGARAEEKAVESARRPRP